MADLVKDVVCGMEIDPASAAGTSDYKGATYYFCAVACKEAFDADPEKYLAGGPTGMPAGASSGKRWWEFWKT